MTAATATYRVEIDADSAEDLPPALIEAVHALSFKATNADELAQNIRLFTQGYLVASYGDASALTVEVNLGEDGNGTGVAKMDEWEITFTVTQQAPEATVTA